MFLLTLNCSQLYFYVFEYSRGKLNYFNDIYNSYSSEVLIIIINNLQDTGIGLYKINLTTPSLNSRLMKISSKSSFGMPVSIRIYDIEES